MIFVTNADLYLFLIKFVLYKSTASTSLSSFHSHICPGCTRRLVLDPGIQEADNNHLFIGNSGQFFGAFAVLLNLLYHVDKNICPKPVVLLCWLLVMT